MKEIIKRIKIFEGYSEKPYVCPAGKWTIGYGYNYQDRGFDTDILTVILSDGFDEKMASEILENDIKECVSGLNKMYPFYSTLSEPRQAVMIDMAYQLGLAGLHKFRKMLSALNKCDYQSAADEMRDSLWFRQSGRRSVINLEQMVTGEWQEVI